MRRLPLLLLALLAVVSLAAACGGDDDDAAAAEGADPVTLHLGVFPNVTHATGLVGIEEGLFERALDVSYFNAGPEASEALLSGAIDATYIGPNPAINAFAKSNGEAIRIIAGATSGGAFLVTTPDITDAAGLAGKKIATPQLGNTQDVALRAWLQENDLESDTSGGGDVCTCGVRRRELVADEATMGMLQAPRLALLPEPERVDDLLAR